MLAANPALPMTATLAPGQTEDYFAGFPVDTTAQRYDMTCTIDLEVVIDPVVENDTYTETIP